MRLTIGIDRVVARGSARLRHPLLWPVWFSVDDATLRYFTGDPTATGFLHAPGPAKLQENEISTAWAHRPGSVVLPHDQHLYGFALLLTEGGENVDAAWQAYDELASRIHALTLAWAAHVSGLGPLLAGFGGSTDSSPIHDPKELVMRLREGMAPNDLDATLSGSLLENASAFRTVGRALARALPRLADSGGDKSVKVSTGITRDATVLQPKVAQPNVAPASAPQASGLRQITLDPQVLGPKTVTLQTPQPKVVDPQALPPKAAAPQTLRPQTLQPPALQPQAFRPLVLDPQVLRPKEVEPEEVDPKNLVGQRVTLPPLLDRIGERLAERLKEHASGLSELEDGTVVAATVQAWRPTDLRQGRALAVERALPAAAPLRASLVLSGSIQLDD